MQLRVLQDNLGPLLAVWAPPIGGFGGRLLRLWSLLHFEQEIGHLGSDDALFWSSLLFGQEIGHLGSDFFFGLHYILGEKLVIWELSDDLILFGLHYILGKKLVIWEVMTFFFWSSLHCTSLWWAKIWATARGCQIC